LVSEIGSQKEPVLADFRKTYTEKFGKSKHSSLFCSTPSAQEKKVSKTLKPD
jgi:hypothetical protein